MGIKTLRYRCLECFSYFTSGHAEQWCPTCGGELMELKPRPRGKWSRVR